MGKDVHAAKLGIDAEGDEKRRAVCASSKRIATVALGVPSAERSCLAMREKFFMKNMTRRLGAVSDCFVLSCRADKRCIEILK